MNRHAAAELIACVLSAAALDSSARVLELYCGGGLLTQPLSETGASVCAVESDRAAVADARQNAPLAEVVHADVGAALASGALRDRHWDCVVLDPPRTGVEYAALQNLLKLRALRIVYIACDPASQARDVKHLIRAGYQLRWAQPIDMFPQTAQVESVALLELAESP